MKHLLAIVAVLVVLLTFSTLVVSVPQAGADGDDCVGVPIGPKGKAPCDNPTPEPTPISLSDPLPATCIPDPEGCATPTFRPMSSICSACGGGSWINSCNVTIWWGGAFGNLLLVVGVMGLVAWPLWRHRKDEPVDRLQQQLEAEAQERAERFDDR